jgi:RNA-directed DNA polymerase
MNQHGNALLTKKPLEALFKSMYRGKLDFSEFALGGIEENYTTFQRIEHDKIRTIVKPSRKLKTFHTFLNLFLFEYLPINDRVVFSYRKGFSAYDAVAPHSKGKYFFQSDISNFFASIDRSLTKKTIQEGKDDAPVSDIDAYLERILDLVCIGGSLPPGLPASPVISNSVLLTFDNLTEGHCRSVGCTYTRYSDDIIISGPSREPLEALREILTSSLQTAYAERFELNERKSKLFKTGGKIGILGLTILPNKQISIDSRVKNETEVLLHFYLTDKEKFSKRAGGDIEKASERIAGFLNYVNAADRNYLDKLRRKYGATTIDMFLHRTFS